jgi:hypothetical protein
MAVQDLDRRELRDPIQQDLRSLELLTLHHERMLGVVLQDRMIEFGDQRIRRPVPELKDRRHQPDLCHLVGETVVAQQIEGGGMGGGGAGVGLRAVVFIEHPDRYAFASEQPCTEQTDGAAAGDQDALVFSRHRDAS